MAVAATVLASRSPIQSSDSIVIPPLPDVVCGVKLTVRGNKHIRDGQIISIGICEPGGVVPLTHWICYDFDKREPVISRAYPSDNKIPERSSATVGGKAIPASSSQGARIRFSPPSLGGNIPRRTRLRPRRRSSDDFKRTSLKCTPA